MVSKLTRRLRLFDLHIVDVGMKWHSVNIAIRFSSGYAAAQLRRACNAISSQVGLLYPQLGQPEIWLRLTWLDFVRLETKSVSRPGILTPWPSSPGLAVYVSQKYFFTGIVYFLNMRNLLLVPDHNSKDTLFLNTCLFNCHITEE